MFFLWALSTGFLGPVAIEGVVEVYLEPQGEAWDGVTLDAHIRKMIGTREFFLSSSPSCRLGRRGIVQVKQSGLHGQCVPPRTMSVRRHSISYVPVPHLLLELKQKLVDICVQSLMDKHSLREAGTGSPRDSSTGRGTLCQAQ